MRHALTATASATLLLLAGGAAAQSADGGTQTIVIRASADASAAGLSKPYAGGQVARGGRVGLLGTQDMMDTPFSVLSFTAEGIQDQQAQSIGQVLQNDPAVRNARGFGNFQELYIIRGFPVFSDDIAYNGLYGLLPRQYVAAELIERVEVLHGASAFLNGAAPGGSGLGGAINLMPKRAAPQPLTDVTLGVSSGGQAQLGLDLSRRFGPDRSTGLRANAVVRDGDGAIDDESRKLALLGLGFDWRGSGIRVSADLGHQDQRQKAPRPSVTPNGAIPVAPETTVNWAQPWTYANERQTFGTLRAEFDLAPGAVLWAAAGARRGSEYNVLSLTNANADGSATASRFDNAREDKVSTAELGVRGSFATGPVKHEVTAAAATFGADFKNAFDFYLTPVNTDLNHPVAQPAPSDAPFSGGKLGAPLTTQKIGTRSVAVADVMKLLDDGLQVSLGARRQTMTDRTYNYNTGAQETDYDKSRTSPMLGVLWKLGTSTSLYGNYIEGLVRGEVAPTTVAGKTITNPGQALSPNKSTQTELGAKVDLGRLGGSVAVFSITKPVGALEETAPGTVTFVSKDNQKHRGLELSVFGEAMPGLKLLGGASFIRAEMLADGKQAVGVPRRQLNLGTEWAAGNDLALNARVTYTGAQWADAANTNEVKGWTRLDIGLRWGTTAAGIPLTLRARVDNVLDKSYWASVGGFPGANYLVLGSPRTYSVSLGASF